MDSLTCRIAGGFHLAIDCATPAISAAVGEQLALWPRQPPLASPAVPRRLAIRRSDETSTYLLTEGSEVLTTAGDLDGLVRALQYWLDHEITRLAEFTPIHAGVVLIGGRAIVMPGPSGCGKTTLVAALVSRGAHYFSDEYALLDDEGRVHAYPRRMRVCDEERCGTVASRGQAREEIGGREIGSILALRFVADTELRLHAMNASEAALLLLRNTPERIGERSGLLSRTLRAVAQARAFDGVRGEAPLAADAILAGASSFSATPSTPASGG
jgi:hypothetical protein